MRMRLGLLAAAMAVAATVCVTALAGSQATPGVTKTKFVIGATFPLCLAMCLDVAHEPAEAGAAAALMLLAGYLFAALAPFGLGAVRDLTGSFSASLWALFGTALLLAGACLPLTATRLRPA